jgi:hypothetical protein
MFYKYFFILYNPQRQKETCLFGDKNMWIFLLSKKVLTSSLRGGQRPTWQSLKCFILKEIATVATLLRNDGFAVSIKYKLSMQQRIKKGRGENL